MDPVYLFSVGPTTPPSMIINSGEELTLEVRGAFSDIDDIKTVPTPFTPESVGHPLAPVAGPIEVRGAEPGDAVLIDLLEITPEGEGMVAILRDFGVLKDEFREPMALSCPIRDGLVWFGGRIPIPLFPNLGTISTMPPEGYKPSYAGAYGGDFDQRDASAGSRIHLPVMVSGALIFFSDPHAAISDGVIAGTGIECTARVRVKISLVKDHLVERPIIERDDTIQILGIGHTVEEATKDASRSAISFVTARTTLSREEAYMLLSIVGELRIGTSPRPIMAARLIIPRATLDETGFQADW